MALLQICVEVSLKSGVQDPEGTTIASSLQRLGFDAVDNVKVGKSFEICIDEESEKNARELIDEMCEKLLVNPVLEEYRVVSVCKKNDSNFA